MHMTREKPHAAPDPAEALQPSNGDGVCGMGVAVCTLQVLQFRRYLASMVQHSGWLIRSAMALGTLATSQLRL